MRGDHAITANQTTDAQVQEARELVEEIASLALSIREMIALINGTVEEESQTSQTAALLKGPIRALVSQIGFMADQACGALDGSGEPEVLGDAMDWLVPRQLRSYSIRQDKAA